MAYTTTTNYGLKKGSGGSGQTIEQQRIYDNENADTIDSTMKSISNAANAAQSDADTAQASANAAQSEVDALENIVSTKLGDWSDTVTYGLNALVKSGNLIYYSIQANNLNNAVTDIAWWCEYGNIPIYEENMVKFFAIPSINTKIRLKIEKPTDATGVMIRYKTSAWTSGDTKDTGTLVVNITDDTNYKYANKWYEVTGLTDGTAYYFKAFPYKNGAYNVIIGVNETLSKAGGLIAEYTMDSIFGSILDDTAGSNDLTINNAISTIGLVGNSLDFEPTYYATGNTKVIPKGAKTICGICKFDTFSTTGNYYLMDEAGGSDTTNGFFVHIYNNALYAKISKSTPGSYLLTNTITTLNSQITPATPFQFHYDWDGTTGANKSRVFLNNILKNSATASASEVNTSTYNLTIGNNSNSSARTVGMNGYLDQVRIYSRVLEDYERANIYNGGVGC